MADKGDVQAIAESFATTLKAANLTKIGDDLVASFATLVSLYRTMKADTEAERQKRDQEFVAALSALRTSIDRRLGDLHGVDGRDGRDGLQGPLGPSGKDGATGPQGIAGRDGVDGSPDTADDIRNKLELLTGTDRLNVSAIAGLDELLKEFDKKVIGIGTRVQMGGTTGRDLFNDIDISDQLDGVTSTFQIHAVYNIISVHLSSFPHALRKTIDFTYTPTTITFTSQIDPATTLAAGQTCVLTVVNA